MGKPKIKLRTTEQAANYYFARPVTYSTWFKAWLRVLAFFGKAKKYVATDTDPKTGVRVELHGYAYKGAVYLTKQVIVEPGK